MFQTSCLILVLNYTNNDARTIIISEKPSPTSVKTPNFHVKTQCCQQRKNAIDFWYPLPATENTLSTGAELAGTHKYLRAALASKGNVRSLSRHHCNGFDFEVIPCTSKFPQQL